MRNRPEVTPTQPAFDDSRQRVRRKVGAVGEGGMPVETDPIRRGLVAADANRIHRSLSHGEEPPRERQHAPIPLRQVGQHQPKGRIRCRERLGGLLKYYSNAA